MTVQTLAWAATLLGLTATWVVGSRHRGGWLVAVAAAAAWAAVDCSYGIWAGVLASGVAALIAIRNWWRA